MSVTVKKKSFTKQLMLDDKPFLILGGETRNSSASSLTYMAEQVWPAVRDLHLNTLLVPISWELLEPAPDVCDFTLPDGLIAQAEQAGVKLTLLWFGLWKNGESTYVPAWMKRDRSTYFTMQTRSGGWINAISPFCDAAIDRDAAAFAALMKHLREVDVHQTVIMVQVENEVGVLGDVRDFSPQAETAYQQGIPAALTHLTCCNGTWEEAFGEDAPETFMAWHYAKAIDRIAQQGKAEYALPFSVNCWLEQFPCVPGSYPSGGPTARMIPVWQAGAPTIDVICPDIYLPDFEKVCAEYTLHENPLFVPEARPSTDSAANVFSAVGRYHAMGFSPFAIEDVGAQSASPSAEELNALSIAEDAFDHVNAGYYLSKSYALLENLSPLLAERMGTKRLQGFTQMIDEGELVRFDAVDFRVRYDPCKRHQPKGGGIVLQLDAETYIIAGTHFRIEPVVKRTERGHVRFLSIDEGSWDEKQHAWKPQRRLNGDEQYVLHFSDVPGAVMIRLMKY